MLDCWSDSKFQGFTKAENEFSDRTETQSFQWNRYWQSFRTEVLVWSSQSSDWGLLCVMTWGKNWPQILDQRDCRGGYVIGSVYLLVRRITRKVMDGSAWKILLDDLEWFPELFVRIFNHYEMEQNYTHGAIFSQTHPFLFQFEIPN